MLRLHYVPGSHDSQKRSSPWCFGHFCLRIQVLFSHGLSRFRDRGATALYGLPRMLVRFLPTCHVLFGPTTFGHVPTKFCYVYQVLSRFSTEKGGRWVVFEPVCTHGIK